MSDEGAPVAEVVQEPAAEAVPAAEAAAEPSAEAPPAVSEVPAAVAAEAPAVVGDAADVHSQLGFAAAAARAAALAAQFATPGAEGDDAGNNKRKHDGEGDEQSQKKSLYEVGVSIPWLMVMALAGQHCSRGNGYQ